MNKLKKIAFVLAITAGMSSCVVYSQGPHYRHHWHHHHYHGGYYH